MYKPTEIATLIKKYMDGTLTSEERLRLEDWADDNPSNRDLFDKVLQGDLIWGDALKWIELEKLDQESWEKQLERRTLSKIASANPNLREKPRGIWFKVIPYAAVVFLFSIASALYYISTQRDSLGSPEIVHNIDPGGNRAKLTLADGRIIELSGEKEGIILGNELTYNDGTIIDGAISSNQYGDIATATLATPRGGKYQVILPDGTKVWLNAASKLTYPIQFSEEKRVVELEGEAYFEVTKVNRKDRNGRRSQERLPFLVKTPNQIIEVLGTQFNVMAYLDETATKTTLVEGAVLVRTKQDSLRLVPGEQGVVHKSTLSKAKVNVNQQIAWKNNKFIFYETELQTAMRDLSRWYDLEIIYEGKIPASYFYGEISMENGLAEVLKTLAVGGVKFRMEKVGDANRLVVYP